MKPRNAKANQQPADPHAIAIAKAVQEAVQPDTVILFGSRAVGDYRPDSDLDLLIVTDQKHRISARLEAEHVARHYMRANPPELELGIIAMDRQTFDYCRRANMHIAGQAVIYGVVMSGEQMDYRYHHEDEYPEHWPETRQRIRRAEEYGYNLNHFVETDYYDKTLIGQAAEKALENALKGWLSSLQDTGRYGHAIGAAWDKIVATEDWNQPFMTQLYQAVQDVFDYTTFPEPGRNSPDRTSNWLMLYATIYDYDPSEHQMTRAEETELRDKVTYAVEGIIQRIHQISGTDDTDVYDNGRKPRQASERLQRQG